MNRRSRSRAGSPHCCQATSTAYSFPNSGSVAVEVAMKMAVQYWLNRGLRGRKKFIAFKGGYHGDTTGAMAVCDPDVGMHDLFRGLLPVHAIVDLPVDADNRGSPGRRPGAPGP